MSLLVKFQEVISNEIGDEAFLILNTSSYFAPGDIRTGIFSPLISDRTERKNAIENLQRLSKVQKGSKENYFFVSDSAQAEHRDFLKSEGMEVTILEGTIHFLTGLNCPRDYPHFLSVYNHAKTYHALLEKLGTLPANIVSGMSQCGKNEDALEFGKECEEFLEKSFEKHHPIILGLRIAMVTALIELKKKNEAIKVSSDVYKTASATFQTNFVVDSMNLLAKAYIKDNPLRPLLAEVMFRKIFFQGKSVSESRSDWELDLWVLYAQIIHQYDRLNETAISIFNDVLKQRLRVFGTDDDKICEAMFVKAECLCTESRFHEALNILKTINQTRNERFGEWHVSTLKVIYKMGCITKEIESLELALDIFEDLAARLDIEISSEDQPLYFKTVYKIVKIYMLQGEYKQAIELSSDLYQKNIQMYGVAYWRVYQCLTVKVECLLELRKTKEAFNVLEEVIEDLENYKNLEEDMKRLQSIALFIKNIHLFNPPTGSLHSFAKHGNLNELLSSIEKGEPIEGKDSNFITALQYASVFGKVEIAKVLIKKGAKYPSKLPYGISPYQRSEINKLLKTVMSFFDVVKAGNIGKVAGLTSKEPCVLGARDNQGCTALHWAALRGHKDVLRLLLDLGCDPTVVSDNENTPLHIAALRGHVDVAEALLRAVGSHRPAAMLDARTTKGGNTPLHAAAERGHEGMVKTLLAHGAVYCPTNASGKTPEDLGCQEYLKLIRNLFLAVTETDVGRVRDLILRAGKDSVVALSQVRDKENRTLIKVVMETANLEMTKCVLKYLKYDMD